MDKLESVKVSDAIPQTRLTKHPGFGLFNLPNYFSLLIPQVTIIFSSYPRSQIDKKNSAFDIFNLSPRQEFGRSLNRFGTLKSQ